MERVFEAWDFSSSFRGVPAPYPILLKTPDNIGVDLILASFISDRPDNEKFFRVHAGC
jgi:hypothetical protein